MSISTLLGHAQDLTAVRPGQAFAVMCPDLNQQMPLNGCLGLETAVGNILELGESQDMYIYTGLCGYIRLFLGLFYPKGLVKESE